MSPNYMFFKMTCPMKNKVCNFLKTRKVSQTVVDFFGKQKIDGRVVNLLSDNQLNEYGLTTIGDRITLREKCAISSNDQISTTPVVNPNRATSRRRQELLALLRNKDGDNNIASGVGRPKKSVRAVTFGLRLVTETETKSGTNDRKSTIVKSPLGEKNTIALKLPIDADYNAILNIAKDSFFPNGENPVIGSVYNFNTEIVNARNINIETDITAFNFGQYVAVKKIPGTPKLFLLCSDVGEIDDEVLDKSAFDVETSIPFGPTDENTSTDNATENDILEYTPIEQFDENSLLLNTEGEIFHFEASSPSGEVLLRKSNDEIGITDDINTIIDTCIYNIQQQNIFDPVEILRYVQPQLVTGRALDVIDASDTPEGVTNFIIVDRANLVQTSFAEIKAIENLRNTLEVQFYGEMAEDLGGPRKEFFSLLLQCIKDQYFDPIREWSSDYEVIGKIFALSVLQNGTLPRVLEPEDIEQLFNENPTAKQYIQQLRIGLNALGIYKLTCRIPALRHLFTPGASQTISLKMITQVLKPNFSPEGSNLRREESNMYSVFIQYLREAASGRRGNINLSNVMRFVTGCEEEPVLGFSIQPSIHFKKDCGMFPTANTCINKLTIPLLDVLPENNEIYKRFDYAFSNAYFGMM